MYIISKRSKYLKGISYATGLGFKCRWSKDKGEAWVMDEWTAGAINANAKGKIERK